ncbi:MAG: FkbM family methyltransferase [Pseudomonadota bacterium]
MGYINKIRTEGLSVIVERRLRWYSGMLRVNNRHVGRIVELLGDHVRLDGLKYSVDCPLISTAHKSTIFFGLHEIEERALARELIPADTPIVEFGGGLGVVSCLCNAKLTDRNAHVVVEANPQMVPVLERNKAINGAGFRVINRALAYDSDLVQMDVHAEFVASSLITNDHDQTVDVQSTTLANVLDGAGFETVGIVCDIEGLESDLIEREILGNRAVKYLLAEMHPQFIGQDTVDTLLTKLRSDGFHLVQQMGDVVFLERNQQQA